MTGGLLRVITALFPLCAAFAVSCLLLFVLLVLAIVVVLLVDAVGSIAIGSVDRSQV
jgi:hypothetical protein